MIDDPLNRTKVKRGEELPQAKLNQKKVAEIRELVEIRQAMKKRASELSNANLAKKYGVHVRTIDRVTTGETWGHV